MNLIHPTSRLAHTVTVGHFARIHERVIIGDETIIGPGVDIGQGTIIGDRTEIHSGVVIPPNTLIGDEVYIGPNVTLSDNKYPRAGQAHEPRPPRIGDRASIGAGCVLLPGVRVGAGAMVGAGSVVLGDVPEDALVYGDGCSTHKRTRETFPNLQPLPLRVDDPVTEQECGQFSRKMALNPHVNP